MQFRMIIDHLTKGSIFIPSNSNFTPQSIVDTFFNHRSVKRNFLPFKFITDRHSQIIKGFRKALFARLKIDHHVTAAYDAQSDSTTEKMN